MKNTKPSGRFPLPRTPLPAFTRDDLKDAAVLLTFIVAMILLGYMYGPALL